MDTKIIMQVQKVFFKKALKINPNFLPSLLNNTSELLREENFIQAGENLEKIKSIDDNLKLFTLGTIFLTTGGYFYHQTRIFSFILFVLYDCFNIKKNIYIYEISISDWFILASLAENIILVNNFFFSLKNLQGLKHTKYWENISKYRLE